jgi:hypothetical protein
MIEYSTGTNVSTFASASVSISNFGGQIQALTKYQYAGTADSLGGASRILVWWANDALNLTTPDDLEVFYKYEDSKDIILIKYGTGAYFKYEYYSSADISTSLNVDWVIGQHNEVVDHQITLDWRKTVSDDIDFDGLANVGDDNDADRDSDDDGIIDGKDPNHIISDFDNDGLTDGLENGNTVPVPGIGSLAAGTDTEATFQWSINEISVTVHNFTADNDISTVTNPKNPDTDLDGVKDGIEDCDMPALMTGDHILKSSDLDGKYDGMTINETNPLDKDTDDDGLKDGTEDADHDGLWDWNPSTFTGETCSWTFDTDGDGLGDGLETGKTLNTITTDTNMSFFVPDTKSSTTTNPLNIDSDFDGVPDGWIDGWTCDPANHPSQPYGKYLVPDYEFQWGEGEDKNLNGAVDAGETNPSAMDSDGDHLLDGWDIVTSSDLGSFFYTTEGNFKRYWGELNSSTHFLGISEEVYFYQSAPTDPTNIDSDGDGLVDGNVSLNGLPCELVMSHNNVQQTMYTDPSLQDTDEDGLSDGLEIAGWEVHVIKGSTKQEQKNWTVVSNPTIWDTEGDGLNDYFEFENQSDPNKEDTDADYILDCDERQGELTQIEATPPEILKVGGKQITFEITSRYENYICVEKTIKITVRVRDSSGLSHVRFKLEGQRDQDKPLDNHPKETDVSVSFSYDSWRAFDDGWDINVTAFDVFGNGNCTKTHVDGFCEGVAKYLIKAFWAFVEFIKKLASMVFEWIWNFINIMMNTVFKPITDELNDFKNTLLNTINDLVERADITAFPKALSKIFNHPVMLAILTIAIVLQAIALITLPFRAIANTLSSLMATFIQPLILGAIGIGIFAFTQSFDPSNFGPDSVSSFISSFFNNDNDIGRDTPRPRLNTWQIALLGADIICAIISGIASFIIQFEAAHFIPFAVLGALFISIFSMILSTFPNSGCNLASKIIGFALTCFLSALALQGLRGYKTGGNYNVGGSIIIVINEHARRDEFFRLLMMGCAIAAICIGAGAMFV